VLLGTNWYDSMLDVTNRGELVITPNAGVVAGHEYQAFGVDARDQRVWCWQSWGPNWGKRRAFWLSFDTLDRLLDEQGDRVQPIVDKAAA
jgi:hypothetical protein